MTTLRSDAPPRSEDERTRLVLVQPHSEDRWVLTRTFERGGRFEVVAEADDLFTGLVAVRDDGPDLVVFDLDVGSDVREAVRLVTAVRPGLPVVLLVHWADPERIEDALRSGALGVVGKEAGPHEVVSQVGSLLSLVSEPEPA